MLSYNFYQYSVNINPLMFDDGHGDYNRSYERDYDDFDYADYSTDHRDNNYRNFEKKRRKSEKEIIKDILNRWDWIKILVNKPRNHLEPGFCFNFLLQHDCLNTALLH